MDTASGDDSGAGAFSPPPAAGDDGFWRRMLERKATLLVATALLAVLLLPGLLRLRSDNSPSVFFVKDSPRVAGYPEHRRLFPGGDTVRLVLRGGAVLEEPGLRFIAELGRDAATVEGVAHVSSLALHHDRNGWPPRDKDAFRQRILENRLDRAAGFVSADGRTSTLLVELETAGKDARLATLARLDALLAEAPAGIDTGIVGLAQLNRALDASSDEIHGIYFPLLAFFALAILLFTVRDLRDVLPPLLFVGLCLLATLAPMGYAGAELNLVLATLPPLIFAIALATSLHLLLHCRQLEDAVPGAVRDRGPFLVATLNHKLWPLLWSGTTTVAGFASLLTSPVAPIRSLGGWAALGLAFLTAAAFFVLPPLMAAFGGHRRNRTPPFERQARELGRRLAEFSFARRRGILIAAAVATLLCAAGLPFLGVESNAVHYLAKNHPQRAAIEQLEKDGIGTAAVELRIDLPPADGGPAPFANALTVDTLADLAGVLAQKQDVLGVLDAGTLLRDSAREVVSAPFAAGFQQQLVLDAMAGDVRGKEALRQLLDESRTRARLLIFVRSTGAEELFHAIDGFLADARAAFPDATVEATGEYPLLLESQRYLISTLVSSFGTTFLSIAALFLLLLRSVRLTLIALAPNVWPIVCIYGAMGWLGVPLDIATVMVSSIALGLVVDDTLHTLGHFRQLAPEMGHEAALVHIFKAAAPVYCLNALVLVAGFGVCALSDFTPVARFGGVCAATILIALVGDIVVLGALLAAAPAGAWDRLLGPRR
jgi:uncharacterized protein